MDGVHRLPPHTQMLLHPDAQGKERIAQAIAPTLDKLMHQPR